MLKATTIATKRNKREDKYCETYIRGDACQPKPWLALIMHNTRNIWREQHTREKAKENRLPPQWAVWDFHH